MTAKILISLFFIFQIVYCSGQNLLYVSPGGIGSEFTTTNPGTLIAAKKKVQKLSSSMKEDVVLVLKEGRYKIDSTLNFGKKDSGGNGFRVIYRAEKWGTVSISGGTVVLNWQKAGNNLYKAKYDGPYFRQLYVNGERAIRARFPNIENEQTYGPYFRIVDWNAKKKYVSVAANNIEKWTGFNDIEMVIKKHWNQNRMRLKEFKANRKEAKVFFREPESSIDAWTKGCCPGFENNQTYFFENSIDFLDAPGEWFFDKENQEIMYRPLKDENMETAEVIVPLLETLVKLDGASNIAFEGLIFEHSNWDMPDSARIGIQAGWRKDYKRTFIPGGIQVLRSEHLKFEGNIIQHFGGAGIEYLHSTHDNIIEGNLITDVSGNGIQIYTDIENRNPSKERACRDEIIRNNYVIKTACEYTGNTGIAATYVNNIRIENNEVADMPYTGISIGWGWTDSITGLRNNIVRRNYIHHTGQLHDDGAGIYSLSKSEGSVYSENYLSEIRRSQWAGSYTYGGIYLDNGSSSILIEDNVVENVDVHPLVAWNLPNHGNIFRNNFYTDMGSLKVQNENILKNNVAVKNGNWPAKAKEIMKNAGPKLPKPMGKINAN